MLLCVPKYNGLRTKAMEMKERYEEQIGTSRTKMTEQEARHNSAIEETVRKVCRHGY